MQVLLENDRTSQTDTLGLCDFLPLAPVGDVISRSNCPFQVTFPEFRPHALLRGGHRQTLVGNLLNAEQSAYRARRHIVPVSRGDAIVLHDDLPAHWQPGDRTALLVHGLAGCHRSGYMARTAAKLNAVGVRTFRMDMRAAGAGADLAELPYHCGCTEDVLRACQTVSQLTGASPLSIVGFSLGGNIILKMLGAQASEVPGNVVLAIGVNPAIDLAACHDNLSLRRNRIYNRFFVRMICDQLRQRPRLRMPSGVTAHSFLPRSVREVDDLFTRKVWGFDSLGEYHEIGSARPWLSEIEVPTILLASADDPMIPPRLFRNLPPHSPLKLHVTRAGGHLGFIGKGGVDPDRRWMEWRIVDWITATRPTHFSPARSALALSPAA